MDSNKVEEYLSALKKALKGTDPATIQDALSDAEDHLFSALENARDENPELNEADALAPIIASYGSPEETAAAYREIEKRVAPGLSSSRQTQGKSALARFFGIYADPKAWGALLYMLTSILTGTIYFSWAVISTSFSLAFALFIFGLPLVAFFLLSTRVIGLLEGRIVEALLAERMPRRPLFTNSDLSWQEKLKKGLTDKHTWNVLVYMLLQLPFGTFYFVLMVILMAFSISLLSIPIFQIVFNIPTLTIYGSQYFIPNNWMPLVVFAGILLMTTTLHLAKALGKWHSTYAKKILISE
jgi:hypothetical protein